MIDDWVQPAPIAALCGAGYLLNHALRRALKARCRKGPIRFAGRDWTYEQMCRHWLVLGGTGRGKTFASDYLIQEVMKSGAPMGCTCVKPNDYERLYENAKKAGQQDRVVRIHPGGQYRLNLMETMLKGHGSPLTAAQHLAKVGEVGQPRGSGGANEQFWETQKIRALTAGICICKEVEGRVTIPDVHAVITGGPATPQELQAAQWDLDRDHLDDGTPIRRNRCAELIRKGCRQGLFKDSTSFRNAVLYVLQEMCAGGDRMRGGILAGANNTLGYFLDEPWLSALNGETNLDASMIDEHQLIAIYDFPMMRYHIPARKFQFIWTMDAQLHCMRRHFEPGTPPFVLVRDEIGWVLHGEWDAQVAIVSRSQGLATIDIVQDVNTMLNNLGGEGARHEAMSFIANHAHLLAFGGSSAETNAYASKLIGDYREVMLSGGSRMPDQNSNTLEGFLGVSDVHWSMQWAPRVRPEEFARLPVGVGVLVSDGEVELVDFRRGNR